MHAPPPAPSGSVTLFDVERYGAAGMVAALRHRVEATGARCTIRLEADRVHVEIVGPDFAEAVASELARWYSAWRKEQRAARCPR